MNRTADSTRASPPAGAENHLGVRRARRGDVRSMQVHTMRATTARSSRLASTRLLRAVPSRLATLGGALPDRRLWLSPSAQKSSDGFLYALG